MAIRYNPLRCDGQQVNEYIDETDQAKISTCVSEPLQRGIDFRRHNLTSVDVRLWRLTSIPAV